MRPNAKRPLAVEWTELVTWQRLRERRVLDASLCPARMLMLAWRRIKEYQGDQICEGGGCQIPHASIWKCLDTKQSSSQDNLRKSIGKPFLLKNYVCIYLFMAVLGLQGCPHAFSDCREWGALQLPCAGFSLPCLLLLGCMALGQASFSTCGRQPR